MTVRVVVAKYLEDVSWTQRLPDEWQVCVYDKSKEYVNVGREAETFARAVVDVYDDLAEDDVVVFVQGHPFDHFGILLDLEQEVAAVATKKRDVSWLGREYECDEHGKPHHFCTLPLREQHRLLDIGVPPPDRYFFCPGAQYAVAGSILLSRSRAWWERLRAMLYDETIDGYVMERLWPHVYRSPRKNAP